ncbi:MAG: oxidoreductase [Balneolaceae bacterium]|jgi:NAD(P)-dependent dehydrogenase (short-subunit alcohol dehydrogenase family)
MSFDLKHIPSQKDKNAIVTGANTGLGYETTIGLAKKDVKVIMACRNKEKAQKAKTDILDILPEADLEIMHLDLSSLSSIKKFAEGFKERFEKLDLLINNAGVMVPPYSTTEDGFELQFGVNYLGHFTLTALLIDHMPDNSDSRVVSLSSNAHKRGQLHFGNLQWEQDYDRRKAYSQSKLACLMFGDELDRRLKAGGKKILSVSAHPGVSPTDLGRHIPAFLYNLLKFTLIPFVSHSPKKGALPTLQAALGPNVNGGDYYGPQGFNEMKGAPGLAERAKVAKDREAAKKLWDVSEVLTGVEFEIRPNKNH